MQNIPTEMFYFYTQNKFSVLSNVISSVNI